MPPMPPRIAIRLAIIPSPPSSIASALLHVLSLPRAQLPRQGHRVGDSGPVLNMLLGLRQHYYCLQRGYSTQHRGGSPRRWCRCHGHGGLPHGPETQGSDISIFRSAMSINHMSEVIGIQRHSVNL